MLGIGLCNPSKELKIIDFGGGGGFHYSVARAALPIEQHLKWHVVETSGMVQKASPLLSNSELKFFDSIESAAAELNEVDLVFASSSLQYCENPLQTLEQLLNIGSKHIFITRTPLSESNRSYICIQKSRLKDNGPGTMPAIFNDCEVSYPITFMSKNVVEESLMKNYKIRFSIKEEGGYILENNQSIDAQFSYFCDVKS
jgi:putative methyltransferase (TIGR04325 family)